MDETPDPDELLVRQVARGDAAAMARLVEAKAVRINALARRMLGDATEAEDVVQDLFLRVWRTAGAWKSGRARFDSWMHRVALNLCYDRLRRRERPYAAPPPQVDPGPAPDRGLLALEVGRRVEAALQDLPQRQREAVVLCHYQEMTNIEAAHILDLSVEALESLLARGRRALRLSLADMIED